MIDHYTTLDVGDSVVPKNLSWHGYGVADGGAHNLGANRQNAVGAAAFGE